MKGEFVFIALVCTISTVAKIDHAGSPHSTKEEAKNVPSPSLKGEEDHIDHKKIYTELFKLKRKEHSSAVQSIENIEISKQRPVIEEIVRNVKKIIEENREVIERIGHKPASPFPHDSDTVKESLSKVLENVAFFSDLSVRHSALFEKAVKKDRKLNTVLVWAYNFSIQSDLMDIDTVKVVNIMAQQLGIIPKEESFLNPYDKTRTKEEIERAALEAQAQRKAAKDKEQKAAKKQKKVGPKLVKNEL